MNTKGINFEKVYAKLVALNTVYEKEESRRQVFLERISYTNREISAVLNEVSDYEFRSWIQSAIPVMQCKGK
jgi:hypothetical protein